MEFDKLMDDLKKAGVEVSVKGFFKKGTKQQANSEADVIFKVAGVDRNKFLEEYRKRTEEKLKKMYTEDTENSYKEDHKFIVLQHKLIADIDSFGEPDKLIFGKIRYASNPIDGSIIMLVNTKGSAWRGIPISNAGVAEKIQLCSVCSDAEPIHTNLFPNYYEELVAYTTKPLRRAISDYKSKKIKDKLELVIKIIDTVPHSMLANSCIRMLCKMKKLQISDDREEIVWIPQTAGMYVGADSNVRYDVFNHLVQKANVLAAMPEMRMPMPAILTNDPKIPALNFIDLDSIVEEGECPTWVEFSERFTPDDWAVLEAFIWSIFVANNKGRQLLYIYDPNGFSGKSILISVLCRFLGDNMCASLQKDSLINQFSLAKVWDKRFVSIDDNKNKNLIRSEKMHMMLGSGRADIELKGRNSFSARLNMKVMAAGNIPLEIDPQAVHERTRLIMIRANVTDEILKRFCLVDKNGKLVRRNGKPVPMGDPSFEERLFEEFPKFLRLCKESYAKLCPTNANIILNEEQVDALFNLAPDTDTILDRIAEDFFNIGESEMMNPLEFQKQFYLARSSFRNYIDGIDNIKLDDFKTYLSKRYSFVGQGRKRDATSRGKRMMYGISAKVLPQSTSVPVKPPVEPIQLPDTSWVKELI